MGFYALKQKGDAKAREAKEAEEATPLQNPNPARAAEDIPAGPGLGGPSSPDDTDLALPAANGTPVAPVTPGPATPRKPATPGSAPSPKSPSFMGNLVIRLKDPAATSNSLASVGRTIAHGLKRLGEAPA
ncbi:hypothetical protein CBS147331_5282 [Penicillium roqueforti]|nr:hypothetical protein CBS147331_5282 [Penicillium roqueforti]